MTTMEQRKERRQAREEKQRKRKRILLGMAFIILGATVAVTEFVFSEISVLFPLFCFVIGITILTDRETEF